MILGQIAYLDCLVFVLSLIPQLLLNVNFFELLGCGLRLVPFLFIELPFKFIYERHFTPKRNRSLFVQHATPFQDLVVRCVRFAFAKIPAKIGRVFFSKGVSVPFFKFRLLRHGYIEAPIHWEEVDPLTTRGVRGLLISHDREYPPDVAVYYVHGGGFSMGSAQFYLEPLLVLFALLKKGQYRNPAVFALEYDLVPDQTWPTQAIQTMTGYRYVLSLVSGDASRVCVAGDSAGGTLVLSLLLSLAKDKESETLRPGYATLFSPWVTLISENDRDTRSDFLNTDSLHLYASQYARTPENLNNPIVSPGCCTDLSWWRKAAPTNGFYITYGSEEVFGPEIRLLVRRLRKGGIGVRVKEEPGEVHAWVIARLFLADTMEERLLGMEEVVKAIETNIKEPSS